MNNFRLILDAMRTAKNGAVLRQEMGMSLGDDSFGDCLNEQVDNLLDTLGLSYDPMDENSIGWENHCLIYNRFRGAFNRAVY